MNPETESHGVSCIMSGFYSIKIALTWFIFTVPFPYYINGQVQELKKADGLGTPRIHRLTDNVYAITDLFHSRGAKAGVNAGIVFTDQSVVFIDAGMTVTSAQFLWKVAAEKMKGKDNIYLILTHHHSDHVFGMGVLKDEGATVIGHRKIVEELKDDNGWYKQIIINMDGLDQETGDAIYGDVVLSVPDRCIEQDTILTIDGDEIHLLVTPGHVDDEICVYHPKSKTLFTGDAVYEGMKPNTRFGGPVGWRTWIYHLERLKKLEVATVVPGHGRLSASGVIDDNITFLEQCLK